MTETGFGSEQRHALFLVERLRGLGASVEIAPGAAAGEGTLDLSSAPLETLGEPLVVERVRNGRGAYGYNAQAEVFEDLVKAGIVDPTKVVRTALQNAASVAGLLLTTVTMIAEKPDEKGQGAPAAGGGMGGMM